MSVVKQPVTLSLESRLKASLRSKYGSMSETTALLMDISYSMLGAADKDSGEGKSSGAGNGKSRIQALRVLAQDFTDVRRFVFSGGCRELATAQSVPDVEGGTAMHIAFTHVKLMGISHVILITDGDPDDEGRALIAAAGLKIDCFYVGPEPAPDFLSKLCAATGGQYGKASMSDRALSARVRLMIGSAKGAVEL